MIYIEFIKIENFFLDKIINLKNNNQIPNVNLNNYNFYEQVERKKCSCKKGSKEAEGCSDCLSNKPRHYEDDREKIATNRKFSLLNDLKNILSK